MNDFFLKLRILSGIWKVITRGASLNSLMLSQPVRDFEQHLAEFSESRFAISVASGTDALILSLKAFGIGPGDEVIVPAHGFHAAASAVAWVNARPIFVDVEKQSHNIDPKLIQSALSSNTKAIIPMHLNGRVVDIEPILSLGKQRNIAVIADAAHAIGAQYQNRGIGQWGDTMCLSLNPTKTLWTYGDGGAILTNRPDIAEKLTRMRIYGAARWYDIHERVDEIGIASRLNVLQAIALNEHFAYLPAWIVYQKLAYERYRQELQGIGDLELPLPSEDGLFISNGYRFTALTGARDQLIAFLGSRGVTAYSFYPQTIPSLSYFHRFKRTGDTFPIAERIATRSIILPTRYSLTEEKIEKTIQSIRQFFATVRVSVS